MSFAQLCSFKYSIETKIRRLLTQTNLCGNRRKQDTIQESYFQRYVLVLFIQNGLEKSRKDFWDDRRIKYALAHTEI